MRIGITILILTNFLFIPLTKAESLVIPGHVDASPKQVMPKRGSSMETVSTRFGDPDQRFGPIGEPPITEWVYGSFRVYFEYQTVLHTIDLNTLVMPK